jgi:TonB-linked SusC/RagA family outer membrane protein
LVLGLLLFINDAIAQQEDSTYGMKRVTLSYTEAPLKTIVKSIEAQAGIKFLGGYDHKTPMSMPAGGGTVLDVLRQLHDRKGYTWRWKGKEQVILYPPPANWIAPSDSRPAESVSSSITVTGTVMDEKLVPVPGVTIQVRGEKKGTNTGTGGRFQLEVSHADAVLEIRSIGYETQRIPLAGQRNIRVQLKASDKFLGEVVVTGYTEGSKRFLAGAVSKVSPKPIRQVGTSNGLTGLQGLVPGLQVDQTSGAPGSAVSMQLRGRNSVMNIGGPLIVINRIPYVGSFPVANLRPSIASQNVNGGISSFNLQMFGEIKSITILKDADATSIYGSRGANGVMLIETVRGKPGKLTLDATLVCGGGKVARKYKLFKTEEYLAMRREALRNDGLTAGNVPGSINYAPDLTIWDQSRYTDWQKELMGRTAIITDLSVALSFGDEHTQVRIGGSYYKETTVFARNLFYSRTGVNVAVDHISKDSTFQASIYGIYSADQHYWYNGSVKAVFTPSNATAGRGEHNNLLWEPGLSNPYADFLKRYSLAKRNYLFSVVLQWKPRPIKGLSIRTNLGISGLTTNENDQLPIASQNPLLSSNLTGSSTIAGKNIWGYIAEPIIEYHLPFVRDLTVVAGASLQYTATTSSIVTGEGYTNDSDLLQLDKAPYFSTNFRNKSEYKYRALFTQLKYQWKEKYIANANLRRDVSSRFSPKENSGYFWSLGAAWIFSEESFFKKHLPWLRFGKLRGSIGLTGSDMVEDNQYLAVWTSNSANNPYQGVQGISPQAPYNPGFSWERCLKKEIALDLAFCQGRLQTNISYFRNKSYNQLLQTVLPAQSGFQSMMRNGAAEILNTGIEMMVSADVVKSDDVQLQLSANLTLPRNKVVAFENLERSRYYGSLLLNEPVTVLNKLKSEGVDGMDGLYKMKDVDGNSGYNVNDYVKIGSLDPKLLAGFQINFSWKNIALDVVVDIRKQMGLSYLYPMMLADLYPGGLSNQITDVRNRWQQAGDEGKKYQQLSSLPAGAVNGNKSLIINSDLSYDNTSYAKLREVSLYYTLPKKITSRMRCNQASVFFIGRNLLTISSYPGGDPEIANALSLSTLGILSFGIKLSL